MKVHGEFGEGGDLRLGDRRARARTVSVRYDVQRIGIWRDCWNLRSNVNWVVGHTDPFDI